MHARILINFQKLIKNNLVYTELSLYEIRTL